MKLTETELNQHIAQRHSPLVTHNGRRRIDTQQLLASGVLTSPHRTPRPRALSPLQRLARCVRSVIYPSRTSA